jgi:hypothetical protein
VSWRPALAGGLAAAAARLAYPALASKPPGGRERWTRRNHRGAEVTLLEGPAVTAAAAAAAALGPGLRSRHRAALTLAGVAAGAAGCYDDLAGGAGQRGFAGHLGALAGGEITTGAVKICAIGAAAVAASLLIGAERAPGPARRRGAGARLADLVIDTGLVAGGANLVNLFDLRPGRALKLTLLASAALAAGPGPARIAIAGPAGAAAALLPEDLAERAMLGDAGANALGAMLGVAAAAGLPRPARLAVLSAIAALTAASERVSFTAVIERVPALRWLDMLGRHRQEAR